MSKHLINGQVNNIINQISHREFDIHNILIYPSLNGFREIYSSFVKKHLVYDNRIVLFLTYYETVDKVREVLSSDGIGNSAKTKEDKTGNNYNNNNTMVISEYEKEGSFIIKDGVEVYTSGPGNNNTMLSLIEELVKRAESLGKDGLAVIADLGPFYHHFDDIQKLVDYELSLPPPQYDSKKLKGVCVYHKEDFEKRLTEEQKQKLLQHHRQAFIVEEDGNEDNNQLTLTC